MSPSPDLDEIGQSSLSLITAGLAFAAALLLVLAPALPSLLP